MGIKKWSLYRSRSLYRGGLSHRLACICKLETHEELRNVSQ